MRYSTELPHAYSFVSPTQRLFKGLSIWKTDIDKRSVGRREREKLPAADSLPPWLQGLAQAGNRSHRFFSLSHGGEWVQHLESFSVTFLGLLADNWIQKWNSQNFKGGYATEPALNDLLMHGLSLWRCSKKNSENLHWFFKLIIIIIIF